jgi:hypothetical protein
MSISRLPIYAVALVVLAYLAIGVFPVAASSPANNGTPPAPVDETPFIVPAGSFCPFDLQIALTGKAKNITLPNDRFIYTAPGQDVTLTNLSDPSKQVMLNITGSFHVTTMANGHQVWVSTGRSLLGDPVAGLVLAVGRFTWTSDAQGNNIMPLSGTGQLADICAMLG